MREQMIKPFYHPFLYFVSSSLLVVRCKIITSKILSPPDVACGDPGLSGLRSPRQARDRQDAEFAEKGLGLKPKGPSSVADYCGGWTVLCAHCLSCHSLSEDPALAGR